MRRGAVFEDSALVQDQDLVGALHGRQAVGDNDARPRLQQLVHRAFDELLGGRIETR